MKKLIFWRECALYGAVLALTIWLVLGLGDLMYFGLKILLGGY